MHRIIAAALAATACASSAQAQTQTVSDPSDGPTLTLQEALQKAGAASPALAAGSAGVRIATAQRDVAALRPNPRIVAETENVAGSGMYRGVRSSETTVGLELPLELGGKRTARIGVADAQHDRADIEAAIAAADLRLRVTRAYTDAASAQRRLTTASDQVGIATDVLRAARVRVAAGKVSPIEEQRATVALINAEAAFERAQRAASLALGNLSRLIDASVQQVDLDWFVAIAAPTPHIPADSGDTLTMAAARADLNTADAHVRLARSQRTPDLTVSASARRLEASKDTAAVFGVSIPLGIFNNGRAAVKVAAAQRDQADALRRLASLDAEQAIAAADADLANAATSARFATGPALAAAQETARIARIGYREGKFGQLDLLDAERTLLETRSAAIDALATYHDAQARLERLTARAPTATDDGQ